MKNNDLKILGLVYAITVLVMWLFILHNNVKKEFREKIEAMSIAIQLDDLNEDYIATIEQMNKERDMLEDELKYIYDSQMLIKDLRQYR